MASNSKKKKTIGHYIRTLKKQDKPGRYLVSRLLWKTGLSVFLIIDKGSYKLRFYPSSTSASCWYNPDLHKADEEFFSTYLRGGDIVIDLGANIGVLTLKAASIVGNTGKVFSVEAHPTTFEYLKGNVSLNSFANIEAFNVAMGDRRGVVTISNRKTSDDQNKIVQEGGTEIQIETLDTLLNEKLEGVDLLKIDVEGYEKFVLLGAGQILQKTECIYFESSQQHFLNYGYSTADIFEILCAAGFGVFKMEEGKIHKIARAYVSETTENLLAIRNLADFTERTNLSVAD